MYIHTYTHTPRAVHRYRSLRFRFFDPVLARSRSTTRHVRGAAVGCRLNRSLRAVLMYRPERIRKSPPSDDPSPSCSSTLSLASFTTLTSRLSARARPQAQVFTDRTRSLSHDITKFTGKILRPSAPNGGKKICAEVARERIKSARSETCLKCATRGLDVLCDIFLNKP